MDLNDARVAPSVQANASDRRVNDRMHEIRQTFIESLGQRILLIERNWIQVKAGIQPAAGLAAVTNEVHKIAGIAASLGHHDLGLAAKILDERLQAKDPRSTVESLVQHHDAHIEAFMDLLETAMN